MTGTATVNWGTTPYVSNPKLVAFGLGHKYPSLLQTNLCVLFVCLMCFHCSLAFLCVCLEDQMVRREIGVALPAQIRVNDDFDPGESFAEFEGCLRFLSDWPERR